MEVSVLLFKKRTTISASPPAKKMISAEELVIFSCKASTCVPLMTVKASIFIWLYIVSDSKWMITLSPLQAMDGPMREHFIWHMALTKSVKKMKKVNIGFFMVVFIYRINRDQPISYCNIIDLYQIIV
jgi:hypothetical protein